MASAVDYTHTSWIDPRIDLAWMERKYRDRGGNKLEFLARIAVEPGTHILAG